jgi:Uma2 family endonuclease
MAVAIPETKRSMMTAAEFEANQPREGRFELLAGEIVEMAAAGGQHSRVGTRFLSRLDAFVDEHGLGGAYGPDTGFVIQEHPDTVVVPDVAFVRADRLPPEDEQAGFLRLVPDLVLEVVSPYDTRREVADKVALYLAVGVKAILVADVRPMQIVVHRSGHAAVTLGEADRIEVPDLLPGFSVPVRDVLRPRARQSVQSEPKSAE